MKVEDIMTRDVRLVGPDETIQAAAAMMIDLDAGVLPVADGDRLVGMITDRDIALRGVAEGKSPDTPVREVMSAEVHYCFDDQDTDEIATNMAEQQIRRLPVLDRDKRLVGIVSLGDLANRRDNGEAGDALSGISRPGGEHRQTLGA